MKKRRFMNVGLGALVGMAVATQAATFDMNNDIFVPQFDSNRDPDEFHSIAALGSMLAHPDYAAVNTFAVHGAYGIQDDGRFIASPELLVAVFGAEDTGWVNASPQEPNWNGAVAKMVAKVKPVLLAGGKVWVAEGGQSDFTADWVRALIADGVSASAVSSHVFVVQHSIWNERYTTDADLAYVQSTCSYQVINTGDGMWTERDTGAPATPSYRSPNPDYLMAALTSENATAKAYWTEAMRVIDDEGYFPGHSYISVDGVDFSDVVEAHWIFGSPTDCDTVDTFWSKFVVSNDDPPPSGSPAESIIDFTHADGTHTIRTADVDSLSGDTWTFSDSTLLFDGTETGDDSNTKIYGGMQATWNNTNYTPNLQLRNNDDRLQLQVNAGTDAQGLEGGLIWNKADFLNHSGETVVFNAASSMRLTIAKESGSTTARFVVNNAGIYYVSNISTNNSGTMTLNDPGAEPWAPISTLDYSIGTYAVQTFSDIRGVGIYLKQSSANQTIFQLVDFQVSASKAERSIAEEWLAGYGLSIDDFDWDADLENGGQGDGMNNLMEYALGGNPVVDDAAEAQPKYDLAAAHMYCLHTERTDDPGLTYTVQLCTNLVSRDWKTNGVEFVGESAVSNGWKTNGVEFVGESAVSNGWKTVTNRTDIGENEFMRLIIEQD